MEGWVGLVCVIIIIIINSAKDRRGGYVLERMFTKFSEITQYNGHYAVQGHSRSPILVPIESSYTTSY